MKQIYIFGLILATLVILLILQRNKDGSDLDSSPQADGESQLESASSLSLDSTPQTRSLSTRKTVREPTITELWGEIVNPAADCEFSMRNSKLRMWVPGSELPHDMNPQVGTPGSSDAPRLLKPVAGDFSIQVKIGGEFAPGEESTQPGFTGYSGAGLLVMADELNFVRLERATMQRVGSEEEPYTNFEIRVDGVTQRWGDTEDFPTEANKSTWLRLERKGDEMHGSMSHDGINWITTEPKQLTAGAWSDDNIKAGVLSVSISKQDFYPEFSEILIE